MIDQCGHQRFSAFIYAYRFYATLPSFVRYIYVLRTMSFSASPRQAFPSKSYFSCWRLGTKELFSRNLTATGLRKLRVESSVGLPFGGWILSLFWAIEIISSREIYIHSIPSFFRIPWRSQWKILGQDVGITSTKKNHNNWSLLKHSFFIWPLCSGLRVALVLALATFHDLCPTSFLSCS